MREVFITDSLMLSMPKVESKEPRQRYKDYFNDLYKLYGSTLDDESFYQGGQFSFAELGDKVLESVFHKNWLNDLDILLPSYWSFEFDPDYSSCGPYFQEKYGLTGQLFDVCEQGTLAGFTGLHILQKYLCEGDDYQNGILLVLEQTTVPRKFSDFDVIPQRNGACGLLIEQNIDIEKKAGRSAALRLHEVQHHYSLSQEILISILNRLPSPDKMQLIVKKNTQLWKILKNHKDISLNCQISFMPYEYSMLTTFEYLDEILKNQTVKNGFYILIEEDVESVNSGILIVEKVLL